MKKTITLCLVLIISALTVMATRNLYVEKAVNVRAKIDNSETELKAGSTIDENTKVLIPNDGMLVVVDKSNGKRWLIKKKYKGKVGKVAKEKDKGLMTTSKSFFYTYSQSRAKDDKRKAGVTLIGGNVGTILLSNGTNEPWKADSTYQFLDEIETDSISYILVE
ncbi:MAG: hypothetical protein J6X70_10340 [Muribaculaceae bacterium]|nr:hypothetical protein [Muribaculaceae bacterium]